MSIVNYLNIDYNNIVMISYRPFWETLKKKGVSTYTLIYKYGISSATIARIKKGEGITTTKINDFCNILDCTVSDIIEHIPE